jgi:hypothetical protein
MNGEDPFNEDLLRRDPAAFFGLPEGFDAKDLRRAYHAAIRRFRPETHPREFQALREAHDRLATWVRFRPLSDPGAGPPMDDRLHPRERSYASPRDRTEAFRALSTDPAGPGEYVALALLSDTLPPADLGFEAWILEGLARHPDDEGLECLLRVYAQEEIGIDQVRKFLRRAATALPGRLLWSVPIAAWETAASGLPFADFRSLWEECEDPGDALEEGPRAGLLAYLLPVVAPRADPAWLDERIAWLGERHDLLWNGAASLDALEAWRPLRDAIAEGRRPVGPREARARRWREFLGRPAGPARFPRGPTGDAVLEMAGALLAAGTRTGGARLAEAAKKVAGMEADVLRVFSPPDAELAVALRFLPRCASLLAGNVPSFDLHREPKEEASVAYAVHRKADQAMAWSREAFLGRVCVVLPGLVAIDLLLSAVLVFVVIGAIGLGFGIAVASVLLPAADSRLLKAVLGLALGGAAGWAGWYLLKHRPNPGAWAARRLRKAWERYAYRRKVRPVVVEAVRDLGISPEAILDPDVVVAVERNELLVNGVAEDPALHVLLIARRFGV